MQLSVLSQRCSWVFKKIYQTFVFFPVPFLSTLVIPISTYLAPSLKKSLHSLNLVFLIPQCCIPILVFWRSRQVDFIPSLDLTELSTWMSKGRVAEVRPCPSAKAHCGLSYSKAVFLAWLLMAVQMPEMNGEKLQALQTGRLRKLNEWMKAGTNKLSTNIH